MRLSPLAPGRGERTNNAVPLIPPPAVRPRRAPRGRRRGSRHHPHPVFLALRIREAHAVSPPDPAHLLSPSRGFHGLPRKKSNGGRGSRPVASQLRSQGPPVASPLLAHGAAEAGSRDVPCGPLLVAFAARVWNTAPGKYPEREEREGRWSRRARRRGPSTCSLSKRRSWTSSRTSSRFRFGPSGSSSATSAASLPTSPSTSPNLEDAPP